MKRLFKFLVATATSFSLLIANVPLVQFTVRADGDEPSPKNYTLNYDCNQVGGPQLLLNSGEVEEDSYIYPESILNFDFNIPQGYEIEYKVRWFANDPNDSETQTPVGNYTFTHYAKYRGINFNKDDTNKKIELVINFQKAYHITFESNIWCEYEVSVDGSSATEGLKSLNNGLYRSKFDADTFKTETFDCAGDNIDYISFEGFHRPENVDANNSDYENYRFTNFVINGEDCKVISRYWHNKFCAENLEGGTFDKNGKGLISVSVTGDETRAVRIEWADSSVPDENIQGNLINEHCVFDHGSAKILKVLDDKGNDVSDYYDLKNCKDEYGNGGITVEVGYKIVFELVPEHGYQLATVNVNGSDNKPETDKGVDGANIYTFEVENYCVHFKSTFEEEPDELKNDSNTVKQGNIDLNDSKINGSGLVTVNDLSAADETKYENQQWNDDLEVQKGFEIDLNNRFRIANTDDYWKKEVHDLDGDGSAWVALDLGEDFEPENDNVKIIHITDEGDTEYLDTKYDEATHTVFFKTGGFSTFLVASTDKDVGPEANVPDGFTAEAAQNNNDNPGGPGEPGQPNDPPKPGDPNEPGQPNDPPKPGEPGEPEGPEAPRYVIALDENNELAIGHWEDGEDNPILVPLEIGEVVRGDALFELDIPDEFVEDPEDAKFPFIFFVGEVEKDRFSVAEPGAFSPGHYVIYKGLKVTDKAVEIYFDEAYVVAIEALADCKMTVLDANGKEIKPLNVPEEINYPKFELGDADEDTWTYFELVFDTEPSKVIIEGINNYAILALYCNEDDALETPIGANTIKYPAGEDDFVFIFVWGTEKENDTVTLADSITGSSVVYEGLSEDEYDDYVLVVAEFNMKEIPDDDLAEVKKYLAEKGYSDCVLPMGFNIDLFDKDGIVHEPGFAVRITLVLEKELDIDDGETVAILHAIDEETFEIIEAVYNAKNKTITFETKTFSPFVVFAGTKTAAAIVSTGETTNTTRIVIASVMIAAAAATGLFLIRKKEEEKENDSNPTT